MSLTISKLPFPRFIGIKHRIAYTLPENLFLEQWLILKGTTVTLITGKDFGFVLTPDLGNAKRIFKY